MNDKYDVKGRVHTLEQRKVWNIGLEHLPNRDSFDVEFSPSDQILRLTTYNMAGAVIGSNHFEYNNSGKMSRSLEFDTTGRQIHSNDFVHQTQGNRVITVSETDGKFAGRTVEFLWPIQLYRYGVNQDVGDYFRFADRPEGAGSEQLFLGPWFSG